MLRSNNKKFIPLKIMYIFFVHHVIIEKEYILPTFYEVGHYLLSSCRATFSSCLQYHEMPTLLSDILGVMNILFTFLFLCETVLKLIAYGIKVKDFISNILFHIIIILEQFIYSFNTNLRDNPFQFGDLIIKYYIQSYLSVDTLLPYSV